MSVAPTIQPDFKTLFEASPGLYLVVTPDPKFTIVAMSHAYLRAIRTARDDILGRSIFEVFPGNPDNSDPSVARSLRASLESVIQSRAPHTMAVQKYDIRRPTSEGGGFEARYWSPVNLPVIAADGTLQYIIHRVEDVTEYIHLKQSKQEEDRANEELRSRAGRMGVEIVARSEEIQAANRRLQKSESRLRLLTRKLTLLNDLAEATREVVDPDDVMALVTRVVGEHLQGSLCTYGEVEPSGDRFTIPQGHADEGPSSAIRYPLSLFGSQAAADLRAGKTLVVHDADRELTELRGAHMLDAIGVKAVICCPLVKDGRLTAMMAIHQTSPRTWTADEVELVEAIVERSWAYIERARAGHALRESEAELRQLADAMPQIVWVTRPDGRHEYFNRRWYELLGESSAQRKVHAFMDSLHPDDLSGAQLLWERSIATGEPYEIECRFRRHDGEYRWFLSRAVPVRGPSGSILRWFGTSTEIEDLKRLQEERSALLESERAARGEAERQSQLKDEFLATLSHELRTPLNAVLGWTQILRRQHEASGPLAEGLVVIERNARLQARLIEDLLDMNRIASGKLRLDIQLVEPESVVEGAIETVRPAADAKGIQIQKTLHRQAGPVSGDPNRLQQVVWNLLSNAIKFTPRGGTVRVLVERVSSDVEITVSDTGQGIRSEFLPHVFERFRQADSSTTRKHGGLGLGLAIVKQLVELHGGTVRVESPAVGGGTTFKVHLPVMAVRQPIESEGVPSATAKEAPSWRGDAVKLRSLKVLVVDDEPDARELIRRVLKECEAEVLTAASGLMALDLIERERPDVLVSDIGMPEMDGYELLRRVRDLGEARGGAIPAIALTAFARDVDREHALQAGYLVHVAKPVEPSELVATVARAAVKRT